MKTPIYGQVVVGPPGSGKTTYCDGMQQYLRLLGRDAWVINMDPANHDEDYSSQPEHEPATQNADLGKDPSKLPYQVIFDVCEDAVELSSVMSRLHLGPNGGLMYCMEYCLEHAEEIIHTIQQRLVGKDRPYLLLDFPGQVELYTHSNCVKQILHKLVKALDLRLTAVQLIDAYYCTESTKFLAAALLGTSTMLRLELPTVSVLSKVDLLSSQYGSSLPVQLDFFSDCRDLDRLLDFIDNPLSYGQENQESEELDYAEDPDYQKARAKRKQSSFSRKFSRLHAAMAELVDDFGLLTFVPLDITNAESVGRVLARIDRSNGFVFTTNSTVNQNLFECAVATDSSFEAVADVRERLASPDSIAELEHG